jgi:hypothetical protein
MVFISEAVPALILAIVTWFYMTESPAEANWLEKDEREWLVPRVAHIAGYNLFSFTRASAVVKCQSALTCFLFRLSSQAATSSARVSLSGIRRSRH